MKTTVFDARTGGGLKITQYGHQLSGIISVPDNYATAAPAGGWPLLIFFHGRGEASSTRDITKLYAQGIPKQINANQWNRGFVVLAVQDQYATPETKVVKYILDNKVFPEYNIDRTRVYTTGLSYGGGESLAMAIHYPDLIAGVVSASPSSLSTDPNSYAQGVKEEEALEIVSNQNIPVSFWVGQLDGDYVGRVDNYYNRLYANGNASYKSGKIFKFSKSGAGHNGWDALYYGTDLLAGGKNMYDFLLQFSKAATQPEQPEEPETPEEPAEPKLLLTIQVYDNGTTKNTKP